jgi:hypothetical protein
MHDDVGAKFLFDHPALSKDAQQTEIRIGIAQGNAP